MSTRVRIRELLPQLHLGRWSPGRLNSITDVAGVLAHTETLQPGQAINTGVTTILPRLDWYDYASHAAVFSFNGCGEMTGSHWINETGQLTSPIVLTTNTSIGEAFRGVMDYAHRYHADEDGDIAIGLIPLVTETYDGFLNQQSRFAVTPEHVVKSIRNASSDPVPEGCTGGGTGMMCHGFKGGTGSSSRIIPGFDASGDPIDYTLGVLVQANYGLKEDLRIGGVPVGRAFVTEAERSLGTTQSTSQEPRKDGSIIVVIATDAPLIPAQLQRLAKRATVGISRVGGWGSNSSGDIFLAFTTAAKIPSYAFGAKSIDPWKPAAISVETVNNGSINGLLDATADATEEAIYNALCMAETTTGYKGRTVEAMDLEKVKEMVGRHL